MGQLSTKDVQKYDCFGEDGDWVLLDTTSREYFANEFLHEINQDHQLYNIGFEPVARRYSKDEALFVLDNGKWIILKLTYSKKNLNGWPKFEIFETYNKALNHMEAQYRIEFS